MTRALLAALLALPACAHVKSSARACSDVAVASAAEAIAPVVAAAITCSVAPDGGLPACGRQALADILRAVGPDVLMCAISRIHDATETAAVVATP